MPEPSGTPEQEVWIMASETAGQPITPTVSIAAVPYKPSWIDTLSRRLEASRLGPWIPYALLALGLALLAHVLCWLAGAFPFPLFSLPVAYTASFTPLMLAIWAYTDRVSGACLLQFRQASGLTQE